MKLPPSVILSALIVAAGIGVRFLDATVQNNRVQKLVPRVVVHQEEHVLPEFSSPASTTLIGEYEPDLPNDVEGLKEKYRELMAKAESLQAQNEQLLAILAQSESVHNGTAQAATEETAQAEATQIRDLAYRDHVKLRIVAQSEFLSEIGDQFVLHMTHKHADNRLRAWTALGLIPALPALPGSAVLAGLEAEQSGGIFLPETRTLLVPESDRVMDSPEVERRRVAAYTRVLQVDLLDINRLPLYDLHNDDRALAAWSLIQGDAASVAMRSSLRRFPNAEEAMRPAGVTPGRDPFPGAPVSVREWYRFPRSMGHWFVEALFAKGGNDEVNEAYRNPPRSTTEIIHPEYYLYPLTLVMEAPEPPTLELGDGAAYWDNVLGEVGTLLLLKLELPDEVALKASDGWRGDRWRAWRAKEARNDPIWWESRWFNEEDAVEFFQALTKVIPKLWGIKSIAPAAADTWSGQTPDHMEIRITRKDRAVILTKRNVQSPTSD